MFYINLSGFTGKFCETNIDDCASNNPCIHGECTDKVNDFSCSCQPGYTGNTCNTPIDFCETNPCLNGGVCKSMSKYCTENIL